MRFCLQLSKQEVECLQLTTVILNKPQVREMCPHVTLDAMERACMRGEMGRQNRGEMALLVSEGGRWMAGVHGDRLCFHWRNDKSEPVYDIREKLKPLL